MKARMFVVLGPLGSGKGTAIRKVSEKYGFYPVDTGELLRKYVHSELPLGAQLRPYLEKGLLVPDNLVSKILESELQMVRKNSETFLLDGFPRNLNQVHLLEEILHRTGIQLQGVFWFETSEEIVRERISLRRVCQECGAIYHLKHFPPKKEGICDHCGVPLLHRKDDQTAIVSARWEVYHQQTQPVCEWYQKKNLLISVNASGTPEEIVRQMESWWGKG